MLEKSQYLTYLSNKNGIINPGMGRFGKTTSVVFLWLSNNMKPLLVGFGDSWTFGSELDRPQTQSWVVQLADMLDAEPLNLGTPASSISHLSTQLFDFIKHNLNPDRRTIFAVGLTGLTRYLSYSNAQQEFINITPEAVYRTTNIHQSGRPPEVVAHMNTYAKDTYRLVEDPIYNEFLACQAIFQIQQFAQYNEIDNIYFSYFDQLTTDTFGHILYKHNIYPVTIAQALTGSKYAIPAIRSNEYFEGKLFHPNILGHTRIAELLKEFYDQLYPRD